MYQGLRAEHYAEHPPPGPGSYDLYAGVAGRDGAPTPHHSTLLLAPSPLLIIIDGSRGTEATKVNPTSLSSAKRRARYGRQKHA